MQTTEEKVDTGKAMDVSLVNTESIGTESKEQDTSSRSGNDAHADDADIKPIYNEELMTEVHTTAEINIFATGQQHTEQPEFNNERKKETLTSSDMYLVHAGDPVLSDWLNIRGEQWTAWIKFENEIDKLEDKLELEELMGF
ncbi:hypothetical protein Tco_0411529 [Tanacetum coccineum]